MMSENATIENLRKLAHLIGAGQPLRETAVSESLVLFANTWEAEHEQVCQFIRDMYTGRFRERAKYYHELPQWIRDAIEADPIYNTAEEQECEHSNAVSATNEVVKSGYFCPDCNGIFADDPALTAEEQE